MATALHGRLAADRPPPEGLTGFYLTMSAGGAIGGAFVGIVAPLVFPAIWEYPILIAAAAVVLAWTRADAGGRRSDVRPIARLLDGWAWRLVPYLLVAVGLIALMRRRSARPRSKPRPAG